MPGYGRSSLLLLLASCFGAGPGASLAEQADRSAAWTAGLDVTSQYFFRGIRQEDEGLILQPSAELELGLYRGEFAALDLTLSTWSSLHSGPTGSWYEADLTGGLAATFRQVVSVELHYTAYLSPNDAFPSVQEIALTAAWDDSGRWRGGGPFAGFAPAATLARELRGQADGGAAAGTYFELRLEPAFALGDRSDPPATLTLPLAVGLSLDDYYETFETSAGRSEPADKAFGYADFGIELTLQQPAGWLAPWSVTAGIHALVLGPGPETYNAGDPFEVLLTAGFGRTF